jgi:hypothetical protein
VWATRGSALAVAALAGLAACTTRDVETRPFRISAEAGGASLADGLTAPTYYYFTGAGDRVDDHTLAVRGAQLVGDGTPLGDVTIRFGTGPVPDLAVPPQLHGVPVTAVLLADPAARDPDGGPLPIPGFRVALGDPSALRYQLLLWEGTYARADGVGAVYAPANPLGGVDPADLDIPFFSVEADFVAFEPDECGAVYYDILDVLGVEPTDTAFVETATILDHGKRARVVVFDAAAPWTVVHALSWHRDGACDGQAQAWTQLAAWRPAPP